ncbi:MAG: SDR family oxidoreductase [Rhodospirillales bacterium]
MGRKIVITGTSRGTGRMIAARFLQNGDTVLGISRSPGDLDHANYAHTCLDVADESAVQQFYSKLRGDGVVIDALINCAGIAASMPGLLTTGDTFKSVLDTNLLGAFLMTREALKQMKKTGHGRIVHFSSINVPLASKGSLAYTASKAALENINAVFANEIADADITLNTLGLSLVAESGMVEALSDTALVEKAGHLTKPAPISADEIFHALQFLLDGAAKNITNQILFFGGVR